jgi:hypothetical protein
MLLSELEGAISAEEGEKLKALASKCNHSIVEIGSYVGKSTCYLATGAPDNISVYAIDLWNMREIPLNAKVVQNPKQKGAFSKSVVATYTFSNDGSGNIAERMLRNTWGTFCKQLELTGNTNKVIPVKAASDEVAKIWRDDIGLLFIDGDHSHEQCLKDYINFSPFIVSNGYIVFHDYCTQYTYGVKKIVDEIVKPHNIWVDWEFIGTMAIARKG